GRGEAVTVTVNVRVTAAEPAPMVAVSVTSAADSPHAGRFTTPAAAAPTLSSVMTASSDDDHEIGEPRAPRSGRVMLPRTVAGTARASRSATMSAAVSAGTTTENARG